MQQVGTGSSGDLFMTLSMWLWLQKARHTAVLTELRNWLCDVGGGLAFWLPVSAPRHLDHKRGFPCMASAPLKASESQATKYLESLSTDAGTWSWRCRSVASALERTTSPLLASLHRRSSLVLSCRLGLLHIGST